MNLNTEPQSDFSSMSLSDLEQLVLEQMRVVFDQMKEANPDIDLFTVFEQNTGISRKSLQNWLSSKNAPYPQSIEAFFVDFAGFSNDDVPENVKQYFTRKNYISKNSKFAKDVSEYFKNRNLHKLVYRAVKIGYTSSKSSILKSHGDNGEQVLNELESEGLLQASDDELKLGQFSAKTTASLSASYIMSHVNNFNFEFNENCSIEEKYDKAFTNDFFDIADDLYPEVYANLLKSFSEILNDAEQKTALMKKTKNIKSTALEASLLMNKVKELSNYKGELQ